jgi:hypothetical protein
MKFLNPRICELEQKLDCAISSLSNIHVSKMNGQTPLFGRLVELKQKVTGANRDSTDARVTPNQKDPEDK